MKEKSPAFQFYPKDFLTDAKVIMMPAEARGGYITLLCIDWLEDGFRADFMAQLAGIKPDGSAMAQLCECFIAHPSKAGFVTNPRLVKERKKQEENRKERSGSGKKGAKARWNKHLAPMAQPWLSHSSAIQEPMAKNGSSSSSSSSTSTPDINTYTLPLEAPPSLQTALQSWKQLQRQNFRRNVSQVEVDALLVSWAPRFAELEAAIVHSTANGWKNIRAKEAGADNHQNGHAQTNMARPALKEFIPPPREPAPSAEARAKIRAMVESVTKQVGQKA
jgi:hypothetical protein